MMYNWIMRRKLDPREDANRGISNFTGRIKVMHVFVGNFTYVIDFMILEDISSIIDPRLSQLVLGRPFIEISNMTHDPPEGLEHTKSVYLRNKKDKRRGVEYVMNKILGFYKEYLELGPEYLTRIDDEGEVTPSKSLVLFLKTMEAVGFILGKCGIANLARGGRRTRDLFLGFVGGKIGFGKQGVGLVSGQEEPLKDIFSVAQKFAVLAGLAPPSYKNLARQVLVMYNFKGLADLALETVFDAPPGYVGLHTHSFSLANHRLPLTEFFCEVLEYFQVHISRLNPFGCAKLSTFVVMCKAYGCEPSVDLFRGFFNLRRAGKWLTFAKRSEKHISNLLLKVITHIEGWHERFFYVQDSIIPAKYPQLLSEQNKLDSKSFKDKLSLNIEENPMFQRLGQYPTSVRVFPDPILFLAGLKPSWEYGQQRPAIMADGKGIYLSCFFFHFPFSLIHDLLFLPAEMAFCNFIYTKDDEDLLFLPKEPSPSFGIGSPSFLVNTKPLKANEEPVIQPVEVIVDSGESPKLELFVVHPGSIAAQIKDRNCKTRGGSSRPPVKRKLTPMSSTSRATRAKTSSSKDDAPFLTVSDDDEGLPDVLKLKDATACHLKISDITPPA
ncbi:hypothetical protein Tco_0108787 [Tanacetum coccineum]